MVSVMLRQPGAYRGKWIAFRPVLRVPAFPRFVAIECLRCRPGTADPGRAGWYYRQGEVGRYGASSVLAAWSPPGGRARAGAAGASAGLTRGESRPSSLSSSLAGSACAPGGASTTAPHGTAAREVARSQLRLGAACACRADERRRTVCPNPMLTPGLTCPRPSRSG